MRCLRPQRNVARNSWVLPMASIHREHRAEAGVPDPAHQVHPLLRQALDALRNAPNIGAGTFSDDQQSRAAAALATGAGEGRDPLRRIGYGDDELAERWTDCLGRRYRGSRHQGESRSAGASVEYACAGLQPARRRGEQPATSPRSSRNRSHNGPQLRRAERTGASRLIPHLTGTRLDRRSPLSGYNHASNPIANVSRASGARSVALQAQQPKNV